MVTLKDEGVKLLSAQHKNEHAQRTRFATPLNLIDMVNIYMKDIRIMLALMCMIMCFNCLHMIQTI